MYQQPPPSMQKSNNNVIWIVLAVLAVCGCTGVAIFGAVMLPAFQSAKSAATKTIALSNTKQLATGILIYAVDNNDALPPGSSWMDKSSPYVKNEQIYKSPAVAKEDPSAYGFAFRNELSGRKTDSFMSAFEIATVFDSTLLQRNATSGLETLPSPPRYGTGDRATNMIGFLDGHAKATTERAARNLPPVEKPIKR